MVHEHPHTNDRKGLVLLALAVSAQIVCLLQFKVIVGAVVVEISCLRSKTFWLFLYSLLPG